MTEAPGRVFHSLEEIRERYLPKPQHPVEPLAHPQSDPWPDANDLSRDLVETFKARIGVELEPKAF